MSHNIRTETYNEKVNRRKVQNEWDTVVAHEDYGEGATGLPNTIRWIENGLSEDYDEAMERIEKLDNGWYDCLAVKYKEYKTPNSKQYNELKERLNKANNDLYVKQTRQHYSEKTTKSAYIGCKECGSKISVKHLRRNYCPVCGKDLRPDTTLKEIQRIKTKIAELEKQLKEKERSNNKNYEVRWLVKVEYHT